MINQSEAQVINWKIENLSFNELIYNRKKVNESPAYLKSVYSKYDWSKIEVLRYE